MPVNQIFEAKLWKVRRIFGSTFYFPSHLTLFVHLMPHTHHTQVEIFKGSKYVATEKGGESASPTSGRKSLFGLGGSSSNKVRGSEERRTGGSVATNV